MVEWYEIAIDIVEVLLGVLHEFHQETGSKMRFNTMH
jgi:hypothetical protein